MQCPSTIPGKARWMGVRRQKVILPLNCKSRGVAADVIWPKVEEPTVFEMAEPPPDPATIRPPTLFRY